MVNLLNLSILELVYLYNYLNYYFCQLLKANKFFYLFHLIYKNLLPQISGTFTNEGVSYLGAKTIFEVNKTGLIETSLRYSFKGLYANSS